MECDEPRAKRKKLDKTGRFAALQKLKELNGSKHKYEVDDIDDVYEVVDEKEYTKRVLARQDDDWIVNDCGSGYIEDGRDIFDDDLDSESIAKAVSETQKKSKKRKAVSEHAPKGNIHALLSNMPTKKKEEVKLDEDDILSELIQEIDENKPLDVNASGSSIKRPLVSEKEATKNYMKSFNIPTPPKVNITPSKVLKTVERQTSIFKAENILKSVEKTKINTAEDDIVNEVYEKTIVNDVKQEKNEENILESPELTHTIEDNLVSNEASNCSSPKQIDEESLLDDDLDLSTLGNYEMNETKPVSQNEMITEEQLLEGWNTMIEGTTDFDLSTDNVDSADLPVEEDQSGRKVFRFFWWDVFEDNRLQPGVAFLFGKTYCEETKKYVSCCVAVRNIERKIFLLPRQTFKSNPSKAVTLMDVYNEFNETMQLDTFKSRKTIKNYPFEADVPLESEYLEVRYSAKLPAVPQKNHSGETYSRIFGLNTKYLEILLLEKKIKGPCWLEVVDPEPVTNPVSWCKYEVNCGKTTNLKVQTADKIQSPPPLTVAAVNMRSVVSQTQKGIKNEIVMMSCLVQNKYAVDKQIPNPQFQQHFCVFTKPSDQLLPFDLHENLGKYNGTKVQKMDSEKALLNYFIAQFAAIDPDLIVGHDLQGYQLDLLWSRLKACDIRSWNYAKLGKLKRGDMSRKLHYEREIFSGRLVCDLMVSARELIKSRSYDLDTLCCNVLKLQENQRLNLEPEDIREMYRTSSNTIKLITSTMQDTAFILKMIYELNVIPLALQITNIAGNVMSRTLLGGRSERNEFLLLHAFTEKDYLVPDKEFGRRQNETDETQATRKKPTYAGGLVLDPKVGFYDKLILLMDFNSLYPSIIQEYNVCFTTVSYGDDGSPTFSNSNGVLPAEIRKLVESRREVKKLMKNVNATSDLYAQYHIRQMALKLTANSMYGCLGFSNSRFYAKELASFITQKGREILTNTKDAVQQMSLEVIYGDTDSIMINTNLLDYEQVFKVGNRVKQEINKLYKQVELDIDGVFKYLLLLKKKKYAAVTISKSKSGELKYTHEYKGLDIVRRDWSQLAAESGKVILNHLLSDQNIDDKVNNIQKHLTKLKEDLEANAVPLPLLVITKQLTKKPSDYNDKNSLPHVQVAIRYNAKGGKQLQSGDVIPYVICVDGTANPATKRAYHVDEYKNSKTLNLDVNYYISQQIYPVISRICEPVSELDSYQVATWLGIEASVAKRQPVENREIISANRFQKCEPFKFVCYYCKAENVILNPIASGQWFVNKCANRECSMSPVDYVGNLINQLNLNMRKHMRKFFAHEMECEDPACVYNSTVVNLNNDKKVPCMGCNIGSLRPSYLPREFYSQMAFYQQLFDVKKYKKETNSQIEQAMASLKAVVDNYLEHCEYTTVKLGELFGAFAVKFDHLKIDDTTVDLKKNADDAVDIYDPDEEDD